MRTLLRLKHWQLFLLTWGFPIASSVLTVSNPELTFKLFPTMMVFFVIGTFGWIWAIATELQTKLPAGVKLNVARFKILFLIPFVYLIGVIALISYRTYAEPDEMLDSGAVIGIIVMLHLFSMACIFLGLRFAAKMMKSVELGRMAHFTDYTGEFFLIWFSVFGVWILQPRLNRLTD